MKSWGLGVQGIFAPLIFINGATTRALAQVEWK